MPTLPVTTTAYLMRNDQPVPVKVTGVFSFTRTGDLDTATYDIQHVWDGSKLTDIEKFDCKLFAASQLGW